ncbi:Ubiquitin carboxyl-terminal hydrolase 8 [Bagarius yarrelli]|uniref:ubiquitinyl hydrolase 1 n=1 Tax=Bagarius yarrelli TaxID=175774 RepID=A0A556VUC1_BAGYA|nr:Ubiquitin carboxyl-terminal hydrolase 8 [Bagarius yarrelli]
MPGVATGVKELYLCTSLGELNKKAEIKPDKTSTRHYVQSACKLFKAAEECRMDRDEEKAYVLYMKYLTVHDLIKKRPDFKQQQEFFMSMLGPTSFKKAIEEAEKLSESLKFRYEEEEVRKKLEEKEKREKERRQQKAELDKGRVSPKAPDNRKDSKKDPTLSVLVMDTRKQADFKESHMVVPNQKYISVPEEAIRPGITVNQIEVNLPSESLPLWKQRGFVDYIILLDWFSSRTDLKLGTTLQSLKDALYKFLDTVTGTYRYYHSPTNRVHLYPPEVTPPATPPATPSKPKPRAGTSEKEKEKEKEREREREREQSKLKRSYSPITATSYAKAEIARPSAAKIRTMNPIFGGLGACLTGLRNLGNTCYMNSILQCLCNTPVLADYFNRNRYQEDINRSNILGHKGEVAEEFGAIMKAVWSGQFKYISPRDFKITIGKINEQFSGYEQQDSQELLLFLMDGLHEDLNKADNRKRWKDESCDAMDDISAADWAWQKHKLLNESIIVSLFQGQFKSTLQCLTCHHRSRTFETFMYLSLPLASSYKCSLQNHYGGLDGGHYTAYCRNGTRQNWYKFDDHEVSEISTSSSVKSSAAYIFFYSSL